MISMTPRILRNKLLKLAFYLWGFADKTEMLIFDSVDPESQGSRQVFILQENLIKTS